MTTINTINGKATSALSAVDGRTLSTLSAIDGQTIASSADFDYTNLLWRLRASDIPGLNNNDPLTSWPDISGNGRNWSVVSAPLYATNQINTHPAVRFRGSGTTDNLLGPDISGLGLTEIDVYLIIILDADPPAAGADSGLWIFNDGGDALAATAYPFTDGVIYQTGFLPIPTESRVTVNPGPSLASWRMFRLIAKTGTSNYEMQLDGTSLVTATKSTLTFIANPKLGRSTSNSGGTSSYLKGYIAEFFTFSQKCVTTQYASIVSYVNSYYGLSVV